METAFLTPKAAEFLICFSSGRESIKWWTPSQRGFYAHGLGHFQLLRMLWMCDSFMGPWLQEWQRTVLRGKGKAHWTLVTQSVDLGALFWHLRELLQNSVIFFSRCFEEHMEQKLSNCTEALFFWDSFKTNLKSWTSYLACSNSNIFSKVITRWLESFVYLSVYSNKIDFVSGRWWACHGKCSMKDAYIFSVGKAFQSVRWCHKRRLIGITTYSDSIYSLSESLTSQLQTSTEHSFTLYFITESKKV